jgi:hypothetical protein
MNFTVSQVILSNWLSQQRELIIETSTRWQRDWQLSVTPLIRASIWQLFILDEFTRVSKSHEDTD